MNIKTRSNLVKISFLTMLLAACSSTLKPTQMSEQHVLQTPQTLDLYAGDIPGEIKKSNQESISDASAEYTFIKDINQPQITIFKADPEIANDTAVIILPGGGYKGVSIVKEGYDVAKRFNSLGITAFVLKYRMPSKNIMLDKTTGPLQDAQQAIYWVRSNAEKWGVNPNKVGIMGFSAGGHLASTAATHFDNAVMSQYQSENLRPDFQILIYPVISMKDEATHKGSRKNLLAPELTPDNIAYFSNEDQVTSATPKAFIVHAIDDKAVPVENALLYTQALTEHKVQTQLLLLPEGGHGFGMDNPFDWFESLATWLKNNKLR